MPRTMWQCKRLTTRTSRLWRNSNRRQRPSNSRLPRNRFNSSRKVHKPHNRGGYMSDYPNGVFHADGFSGSDLYPAEVAEEMRYADTMRATQPMAACAETVKESECLRDQAKSLHNHH